MFILTIFGPENCRKYTLNIILERIRVTVFKKLSITTDDTAVVHPGDNPLQLMLLVVFY